MKITKIECIPVLERFKMSFTMRGETKYGEPGVIIRIYTDEGIVGIGDTGGTSAWYRGESQESIIGMVKHVFAPELLGADPFNIEYIMGRFDFLARDNNQAKALVDYALHDIKGKALGVPVYQLLGGKCRESIPLAFVISSSDTETLIKNCWRAYDSGFKTLKLKTSGVDMELDVKNVEAVRAEFGDKIEMFVDANGAWNYYDALRFLKKVDHCDLAMIEQPVAWWDVDGMAKLRQKVGTPIFVDEGIVELKHLTEFAQRQACDGFFLKVPKAGGLLKSQRFISVARAFGMPVVCGCMAGSGIEAGQYAHLLISNDWMGLQVHENLGPIQANDCYETEKTVITDNLCKNVPLYKDAHLYCPEGPGLGVEINEEVLERDTIRDIAGCCVELK